MIGKSQAKQNFVDFGLGLDESIFLVMIINLLKIKMTIIN